MQENKLAIFEEKEIRREWYKDDWYFSVIDVVEVLVENYSFDKKYLVWRTKNDVPEIDGIVYIKKTKENEGLINEFINVRVVGVDNYDLIGV